MYGEGVHGSNNGHGIAKRMMGDVDNIGDTVM